MISYINATDIKYKTRENSFSGNSTKSAPIILTIKYVPSTPRTARNNVKYITSIILNIMVSLYPWCRRNLQMKELLLEGSVYRM